MAIDTTSYRSPNFDQGRRITPQGILIHSDEGTRQSSLAWLTNPASQVSSHYYVARNGDIYQLVDDNRRAWHAGVSDYAGLQDWNSVSIGIECEHRAGQDWPQGQQDALADLCREKIAQYGIRQERIAAHRWVAVPQGRKRDPTDWTDSDLRAWIAALYAPTSPAASPPAGADGLPTPLPYLGVAQQAITAATFGAVLADHQSPLAPFAATLYQWLVSLNIAADVWLGQCAKESSFGTTGLSAILFNPLNIRQRGDYPGQNGFADFRAGGTGGPWLGALWSMAHLKLIYPARGLYTLEQIVPVFAPASDGNDVPGYIAFVRSTVADMRAREGNA